MTERSAIVMTVNGPVPPDELGITLPHEHLLIDLSCVWHAPEEGWRRALVDAPVALGNRGLLATDPYVNRSNLVLDEVDAAVEELALYRALGGGTVMDLTVQGIGPQPASLQEISRQSGVHVVAGCGWYIQRAHPTYVADASVEYLTDRLIRDITEGLDGTGVRPGIIGEIGTSSPIDPAEVKALRAAAAAQRATGLAINIHVAIFGRRAIDVLNILEAAGANPNRIVISHLDELLDPEHHREVLRRGAYVEFDTFGSEFAFDTSGQREPSDAERIDALLGLLHDGWEKQILLSQDVCTRVHLCRYGGYGYGHLLRTIGPRLERRGVDAATFRRLVVDNPHRVLAHLPR